ncbi:High-affinity nicotinic acid transporter [Hypoxylon texense]
MAATNETSNPERNRGWYQEDLIEVNAPIRNLLENYSHVPSSEVVKHVNDIRERGFAANPYPCIGLYRFVNLTLLTHPLYDTIVQRLKAPGTSYLDVGCCFGQDLRQLVHDGVPSDRLTGLDIASALLELGYEFFRDRATLKSAFVVADVFKGPEQGPVWTQLQARGVDVMHCSAFFHLFTLDEQVAAAKQIAGLIKKGGIIVGRQMGSVKPGNVAAIQEGSFSFRHDVSTFDAMWREVGLATQTRWKVEGTMDMIGVNIKSPVEDENSRRFLYTVTRIE